MTNDQLKEAVAIRLGWQKIPAPPPNYHHLWIRKTDFGNGTYTLPNYVGDIGAAWEIIERLDSRDIHWDLDKSIAGYTMFIRDGACPRVTAETAPLAICKAYILVES